MKWSIFKFSFYILSMISISINVFSMDRSDFSNQLAVKRAISDMKQLVYIRYTQAQINTALSLTTQKLNEGALVAYEKGRILPVPRSFILHHFEFSRNPDEISTRFFPQMLNYIRPDILKLTRFCRTSQRIALPPVNLPKFYLPIPEPRVIILTDRQH